MFDRVHGRSVWRRLAAAAACAVLLAGAATAGIEDMVLRFSTSGPDRYADGTVVADGECYALVWSPAGKAFSGFNADGTAASPDDCVVLAAPLAQNGKCRDAFFQVPAAEYAELEGGEWAVCLVDTRNVYGVPAGVQDGRPLRVNRWGLVQSGVQFEDPSKMMASAKSNGMKLAPERPPHPASAPACFPPCRRISSRPESRRWRSPTTGWRWR